MAKIRTSDSEAIAKALVNEKGFDCNGALSGVPGTMFMTARPPEEFKSSARASTVAYAIYSYATPIAWLGSVRGWIIPETKYSVTTTQHQHTVRRAIEIAGGKVAK